MKTELKVLYLIAAWLFVGVAISLAQANKTLSNRALNGDFILKTTGGSFTVDGPTGNISAPNFDYQTDTYVGDGDITSGSFIAIRQGNMVTILCDSVITHGNFSAPQSAVGLIGVDYRPTANASNVFDQSASRVMKMRVGSDGRIRFEYFDWAGVAVTNTNTNSICSITYYVP